MEPERAIREKWKLTQQAFDKLLAALAFDRNEAGEKYLNLRKNLIRFFEARQVSTAEDAADEVINRLARKLENGEEFENINTYALGVARIVALEISKSPDRKTSNELPEIGVSPFDKDTEEREEKLNCLEKCLRELSAENCQIIIGYYRGERREKIENRQKLADDLGIPNNALRSRAVRLRDKLEICITDCLKKQKFL
jgi:DNA-directed RNA polymerase specialized sigma24 family protein